MKRISVLFCFLVTCLFLITPAQATENAAPVTAGTLEGGFSWETADGVLTITGTGAMPDFEDYRSVPWGHLGDSLNTLVVGEGITHLADYAGISHVATGILFSRVTLPMTLASIGDYALSYNSSLTEISLPGSLTAIGDYALFCCESLTEITIPDNPISIGSNAFAETNISTFHIGKNAVSIGYGAFPIGSTVYYAGSESQWNSIIQNYYRPSMVYTLYTVKGGACGENLTWTLDYTGTLTINGTGAMDNYTSNTMPWYSQRSKIKSVVIEDGITSLGDYAFYDHSNLTSVSVSSSLETIGQDTFTLCKKLRSITLPSGLITIGNSAFTSCTALTSIDIPSTVTSIENYAFTGSGLTKLVIPEGISKIGYATFRGCTSLAEVVLPSTVTSIGNEAFRNCTALKKFNIPNGVTSIGVSAFSFCSSLTEIAIPAGVTSIGAEAFIDCSALKTVVILGGSLTGNCFSYCENIRSITLPASVTAIPDYTFVGCSALHTLQFAGAPAAAKGELVFPAWITSIDYSAFSGCSQFTKVSIPAELQKIAFGAFQGCNGITAFTVNENNPNYCADSEGVLYSKGKTNLIAYPGGSDQPYYSIPAVVTTVSSAAFHSCSNLVNLYIPSSVTNLQKDNFKSCPTLTLCVYRGSAAAKYAQINALSILYMDDYPLQSIAVDKPKQPLILTGDQNDLSALRIIGDYGAFRLPVSDYELIYNPKLSGVQTATVSYQGVTSEIEVLLYDDKIETLIDFGPVSPPQGSTSYGAVYDSNGKMLCIRLGIHLDGHMYLIVPKTATVDIDKALLFLLDSSTMLPFTAAIPAL